ncbi:MAG: hypothetical protein ACR2PT_04765 [Endozoicomonas sp.]
MIIWLPVLGLAQDVLPAVNENISYPMSFEPIEPKPVLKGENENWSYGSYPSDFKGKPYPDRRSQTYYYLFWLVPVLRWLVTVEGFSISLEQKPVSILLPVLLTVAGTWWFGEERIKENIEEKGERVIGDPVFITSEVVEGDGHNSKGKSDSDGRGDAKGDSSKGKEGRVAGRKRIETERGSVGGDRPPLETPPNSKKRCVDSISMAEQLNYAINNQDAGLVEFLLNEGADPNEPWDEYPLFAATHETTANVNILILLLQYGANTEITSNGVTSLLRLVQETYLSKRREEDYNAEWKAPLIKVLVEQGASCVAQDAGRPPVYIYLLGKEWDDFDELRLLAFEQLRGREIDINNTLIVGEHPLYYLAMSVSALTGSEYSRKAYDYLIQAGADVNVRSNRHIDRALIEVLVPTFHCTQRRAQGLAPWVQSVLNTGIDLWEWGCPEHSRSFRPILDRLLDRVWDRHAELRVALAQRLAEQGGQLETSYLPGMARSFYYFGGDYSVLGFRWVFNHSVRSESSEVYDEALINVFNYAAGTSGAFLSKRQEIASQIIGFLVECGADLSKLNHDQLYSILKWCLKKTCDRYQGMRVKVFQEIVGRGLIELSSVSRERGGLFRIIASDPFSYSLASVRILILYGLVPDIPDPKFNLFMEEAGVVKMIRWFQSFYSENQLQYLCYMRIAQSLQNPEDGHSLNIPNVLKQGLYNFIPVITIVECSGEAGEDEGIAD